MTPCHSVLPTRPTQNRSENVYFFHGYSLSSAIALPSLSRWSSSQSGLVPQITLVLGEIPSSLPGIVWSSPFIQIGEDRSALVTIGAVATFWLPGGSDAGSKIIVQASPGAKVFEIETFLLTTISGILLHQRRMLPLHASCVVLDGHAIAINGSSGSGKSALAAALVRRGATLLADAICVIAEEAPMTQTFANTFHARLWPDVMDHLTIPEDLRHPTRVSRENQAHGKHAVSMQSAGQNSWPLGYLVRLSSSNLIAAPELEPLHGAAAIFPPKELVYQANIGHLFDNRANEFHLLSTLAHSASIYSLRRTRVLDHLEKCADLILNAVSGAA